MEVTMRQTVGCAILTLAAARNIPTDVAEAAIAATRDWPGDYHFSETDKLRCNWCGDFHFSMEHELMAAEYLMEAE
jgi:hypothetical protein